MSFFFDEGDASASNLESAEPSSISSSSSSVVRGSMVDASLDTTVVFKVSLASSFPFSAEVSSTSGAASSSSLKGGAPHFSTNSPPRKRRKIDPCSHPSVKQTLPRISCVVADSTCSSSGEEETRPMVLPL